MIAGLIYIYINTLQTECLCLYESNAHKNGDCEQRVLNMKTSNNIELHSVPLPRGDFVGLSSQTTIQAPKLNYETTINQSCFSHIFQNVKPPFTNIKSPIEDILATVLIAFIVS